MSGNTVTMQGCRYAKQWVIYDHGQYIHAGPCQNCQPQMGQFSEVWKWGNFLKILFNDYIYKAGQQAYMAHHCYVLADPLINQLKTSLLMYPTVAISAQLAILSLGWCGIVTMGKMIYYLRRLLNTSINSHEKNWIREMFRKRNLRHTKRKKIC